MSDFSSYTVNNEGGVLNFQGKKIKNAPKFFISNTDFIIRNIPEVSQYPLILRYLNDLLSIIYKINNERLSLTEKNKGGTYPSTSFTITTNMEKIGTWTHEESKIKEIFTIKKSSQFLLKCLIDAGKSSTYFNIERVDKVKDEEKTHKISEKEIKKAGGYEKALFSILKNDKALNECVKFPKGWFWVTFNPFKIELKENEFNLNINHEIRYLSFMTKYIENVSNLSSMQDVSLKERKGLIQSYELFLFEILEKYFSIENVKI